MMSHYNIKDLTKFSAFVWPGSACSYQRSRSIACSLQETFTVSMESEDKCLVDDSSNKLFVGGLQADTTKESLMEYFEKFGAVKDATVMHDPVTKRSQGFGFVIFEDPLVTTMVCAQEHTLDGKQVSTFTKLIDHSFFDYAQDTVETLKIIGQN